MQKNYLFTITTPFTLHVHVDVDKSVCDYNFDGQSLGDNQVNPYYPRVLPRSFFTKI